MASSGSEPHPLRTLDTLAHHGHASDPARTIRLGARRYPLFLPSLRDPRLHLASVIISIHILGQLGLHFRVSVPQILVAILTCALIEVVWSFHRTRTVVWPASAMLTGSGVALILRVAGTEPGDHWTWQGWYVFAAVAGASLLTKYVIRYRGTHVFNPSNVGLVAAFLLLGSTRVEPLDFWWGPLDGWLVLAYAIILTGGLLITSRLRLLGMSAAFWIRSRRGSACWPPRDTASPLAGPPHPFAARGSGGSSPCPPRS